MTKKALPSMLSYTRSLNPSNGLFYAENEDGSECAPVILTTDRVLASFSDYANRTKYLEASEETKEDLSRGNLKKVDHAFLPPEMPVLKVCFSLSVVGNSHIPHNCHRDYPEFRENLTALASGYAKSKGFDELALRYAKNLVNGSFLWRNRQLASEWTVDIASVIKKRGKNGISRKSVSYSFDSLPGDTATIAADHELVKAIAAALSNPGAVLTLEVTARATIGAGQEVYPSEVIAQSRSENTPDRIFASARLSNGSRMAMMNGTKIGAALRTIDTWWAKKGDESKAYPVVVEPYGTDRKAGAALRIENNNDFYTLMEKDLPMLAKDAAKGKIDYRHHYAMAVLIRGGVFSA